MISVVGKFIGLMGLGVASFMCLTTVMLTMGLFCSPWACSAHHGLVLLTLG